MKLFDGLINFVANLAVGNSKRAFDQFVVPVIDDAKLEAMYRGDWLSRKVVDAPIKDIFRPWRTWKAEADLITAIEEAEKRHKIRAKLALAMLFDRLYGGGVIVIGANNSHPMMPLMPEHIGKGGLKYLTVLRRRDIQAGDIDNDPFSPGYGEPKWYTLLGQSGSVQIHASRVIRFASIMRPDFEMNPERWGDSILQIVNDALHNAGLSQTGVAELIHEAKVDIVRLSGLSETLSTEEGTAALTKRFQAMGLLKSINNTTVLDKDDEWDRHQTTWAGLPDIIMTFLNIVSGASDIPVTRLLGSSAKGLNATGEGDARNYYDFLDGIRADTLRPALERLDELLWRDATGAVPKDVFFEFAPLWQMTAKEKADLAKTKAETAQVHARLGLLPEEPLARGLANQLIEDGVYPGFETEMAELLASGADIVPEEVPDDDVQPSGNGKGARSKSSQADHLAGDRADRWSGTRLSAHPEFSRWLADEMGSGQRH